MAASWAGLVPSSARRCLLRAGTGLYGWRYVVPEKSTIQRAREDARQGKSPSTQAGEFVREEIHHVREGQHGVRSPKQAIAIGLSKARRAGVKLRAAPEGTASAEEKQPPRRGKSRPSRKRSQASLRRLRREGRGGVSHQALSRQAKGAAKRRTHSSRAQAAHKAARTRSANRSRPTAR